MQDAWRRTYCSPRISKMFRKSQNYSPISNNHDWRLYRVRAMPVDLMLRQCCNWKSLLTLGARIFHTRARFFASFVYPIGYRLVHQRTDCSGFRVLHYRVDLRGEGSLEYVHIGRRCLGILFHGRPASIIERSGFDRCANYVFLCGCYLHHSRSRIDQDSPNQLFSTNPRCLLTTRILSKSSSLVPGLQGAAWPTD